MDQKSGIQVVRRAAAILRALEGEPNGLLLPEIANRAGLPQSTVQRIVKALEEEQLLESAGPRAGFRIGPTIMRIGANSDVDVVAIAHPLLVRLSDELEETVDLSTLKDGRAYFLDQVVGNARLAAVSAVGDSFPLHCTANGKVLLASLSKTRRRQILPPVLEPFTASTIVDHEKLEAEARKIQKSQLAYDLEEHTEGICAIATAFTDGVGRSFAISIPIPTARFAKREEEALQGLMETRAKLMGSIPSSGEI